MYFVYYTFSLYIPPVLDSCDLRAGSASSNAQGVLRFLLLKSCDFRAGAAEVCTLRTTLVLKSCDF